MSGYLPKITHKSEVLEFLALRLLYAMTIKVYIDMKVTGFSPPSHI